MSEIKFVRGEDRTFAVLFDRAQGNPELLEAMKKFDEQEWYTASFVHHPGGPDEPQLHEVWMPPNTLIAPLSLEIDSIGYVLWGEMHYDGQVYGPGSSYFFPRDSVRSWSSGPQGLMRLTFRPRRPDALGASVHGGPSS